LQIEIKRDKSIEIEKEREKNSKDFFILLRMFQKLKKKLSTPLSLKACQLSEKYQMVLMLFQFFGGKEFL